MTDKGWGDETGFGDWRAETKYRQGVVCAVGLAVMLDGNEFARCGYLVSIKFIVGCLVVSGDMDKWLENKIQNIPQWSCPVSFCFEFCV